MAIAFLTGANGGAVSGTSGANFPFDSGSTGSDRYLIVGLGYGPALTFTSVTYAGSPMTLLTPTPADVSGGGERLWIYGLVNPATGTNNLVATMSDGGTYGGWEGAIAVYTGAPGAGGTPAVVSSQTSPVILTMTTPSDNNWLVGFVRNGAGNNTAGANTTMRGSAYPISIADTNAAQSPAGSYSLNVSWTGGGTAGGLAIALSPTASPIVDSLPYRTLIGVGK